MKPLRRLTLTMLALRSIAGGYRHAEGCRLIARTDTTAISSQSPSISPMLLPAPGSSSRWIGVCPTPTELRAASRSVDLASTET